MDTKELQEKYSKPQILEVAGYSIKAVDADHGIAEMIVSVFDNVDRADERIRYGFFTASLARKLPKGVWAHDWKQPIAKTLEARELLPGDPLLPERLQTLGGLYVKGHFNLETQRGKDAFSDLKFGTVDEFSIGYTVKTYAYDKETGITDLVSGDLYEWSPVLVGCNDATALLTIKAAPPTRDAKIADARAALGRELLALETAFAADGLN